MKSRVTCSLNPYIRGESEPSSGRSDRVPGLPLFQPVKERVFPYRADIRLKICETGKDVWSSGFPPQVPRRKKGKRSRKTLSRRSAITLSAAAAAAIAARPAAARPAVVPVIWDGKKMYETFKAQGTGFSYPGPADRPVAYVAIDPQCPDCMKFTENVKPLLSKVNVSFSRSRS